MNIDYTMHDCFKRSHPDLPVLCLLVILSVLCASDGQKGQGEESRSKEQVRARGTIERAHVDIGVQNADDDEDGGGSGLHGVVNLGNHAAQHRDREVRERLQAVLVAAHDIRNLHAQGGVINHERGEASRVGSGIFLAFLLELLRQNGLLGEVRNISQHQDGGQTVNRVEVEGELLDDGFHFNKQC